MIDPIIVNRGDWEGLNRVVEYQDARYDSASLMVPPSYLQSFPFYQYHLVYEPSRFSKGPRWGLLTERGPDDQFDYYLCKSKKADVLAGAETLPDDVIR